MADWLTTLGEFAADHWGDGLLACASLATIAHLWRRTRWLEELLRREQLQSIERCNAIQQRLLTCFFDAPSPTLQSLANDTETAYKLRPSGEF